MKHTIFIFFLATMTILAQNAPMNLNLTEAEKIGLINNTNVLIKKHSMKISEYQTQIASVSRYPDFIASAGYTYINPPMETTLDGPMGIQFHPKLGYQDNYSLALQMRAVLYAGGRMANGAEAAALGKEAAQFLLTDTIATTKYEIRKSYFSILFLREMAALAKESAARASVRLTDTENKFKAGTATRLEVMRLQTEAADAQTLESESMDRLRQSLLNFKILLNMPEGKNISLNGNLRKSATLLKGIDYEKFSRVKPFFAAAEAQRVMANAAYKRARMERGDLFPVISTSVKYDYANPYLLQEEFGGTITANISATYPIWDWGKNRKEYKASDLEAANARMLAENTRRQLDGYYKNLLDRMESNRKGILAREINLKRARATRDAMEVARSSGAATYNDLADAELLVYRMEVDYMRNIMDLFIAIADWERFSPKPSGLFAQFDAIGTENN